MGPEEYDEKNHIEQGAALLESIITEQGKYNVYRAVIELDKFFKIADGNFALTNDQRNLLRRTAYSFKKVFNNGSNFRDRDNGQWR
jgi:hypothetical protein